MSTVSSTETTIKDILWQSLAGGSYNIETLKSQLTADSRFDEIGLDSLDIVDFFLRLQDHFEIKMREEDYARLTTIKDIQTYLEEKGAA
ncbi:MAG: phosphopantetheine-binding protein [Acidobacteria bacterium]|nr:phosphopantetheine-binding protein [Acidobacteriota bacterium]